MNRYRTVAYLSAAVVVLMASCLVCQQWQRSKYIYIEPHWTPDHLHQAILAKGLHYEIKRFEAVDDNHAGHMMKRVAIPWAECGIMSPVRLMNTRGVVRIVHADGKMELSPVENPHVIRIGQFLLTGHHEELKMIADLIAQ